MFHDLKTKTEIIRKTAFAHSNTRAYTVVSQMRRTFVTRTNCTQQQTLAWHT